MQWGLMQLVAGTYERFLLGFEAEAGLVIIVHGAATLSCLICRFYEDTALSLCYRSLSVHSLMQPTRQVSNVWQQPAALLPLVEMTTRSTSTTSRQVRPP